VERRKIIYHKLIVIKNSNQLQQPKTASTA